MRDAVGLLFLGALLVTAVTPARACLTDADCDNGDTCSIADTCTLGVCVLGGGGDLNDDLLCDAELPGDMLVTRVRIKKNDNGTLVRGRGAFIDDSPAGAFTGDDGISVRVKDALSSTPPPGDGIDLTFTFPPAECTQTLRRVHCRDEATFSRATFTRNRVTPTQIKFLFTFKNVTLTPPFFEPVQVILTFGTTAHRKSHLITDCRLYSAGINCREP